MKNKKGQISAELIIVLAAVLAIALLLVTQLRKTAAMGSERMSNYTYEINESIKDIEKDVKNVKGPEKIGFGDKGLAHESSNIS